MNSKKDPDRGPFFYRNFLSKSVGAILVVALVVAYQVGGAWAVCAVVLFLGLYLLFSSVNEYIDPRTRLRLMGG